jgi:hypothetical protein
MFRAAFSSIKKAITSPISNMVEINLGRAAGIGGAILSLTIWKVQIKNLQEIYIASLAPAVSFFLMNASDYLKNRYFAKYKSELINDKERIDDAHQYLKNLYIDEKLKKHISTKTYKKIFEIIELRKEPTNVAQLTVAFEHSLRDFSAQEKALKYTTTLLDFSVGTLTSMSAIFINFIVPIVLNSDFDNNTIKYAGLILSLSYALYAGLASLANSQKQWDELANKKLELNNSIEDYCNFYNEVTKRNNGLGLTEIEEGIRLWQEKKKTINVTQEPSFIQLHTLFMADSKNAVKDDDIISDVSDLTTHNIPKKI